METSIKEKKVYTFEEYLALEEADGIRYEFFNGEVFAMAGGSINHFRVARNVSDALRQLFEPKGCYVFQENVKLQLEENNYYMYPDVMVSCNEEDLKASQFICHPTIIVEVLSETTSEYDHVVKLQRYIRTASLKYYLLVSQKYPTIEVYSRQKETPLFTYAHYQGMDTKIELAEGISLSMEDIYKNIELTPPTP
ncbi:Uma2 family endonuclease [Parasediminibacterium sp. JCM 36343]|uniref:Uma2 family endonuclease n=1 Tax=Parasediminibacterium sp. JCM 36343 TaxID=3374279 RepID=UPI00397C3AA6